MADERRYLTPQELRDGGYLQEVNRRFFHPLGLALAVDPDQELGTDGKFTVAVWDSRDDPEGWFFAPSELDDAVGRGKAQKIDEEYNSKSDRRLEVCGSVIQRIGAELRP